MIKNKKVIIGIILSILLIIGSATVSFGLENFEMFRPGVKDEEINIVMPKISAISSVLFVIGIISTAVLLAVIGFTTMLGSANEKALAQEKYMGFLVGAILITTISTIAKVIIQVAEKM